MIKPVNSLPPNVSMRFNGIARLYGTEALLQLQQSHVLVVGIGGVGSWVAEALARSGLGNITLIDLDDLCITNTNRQIHALQSTIGSSKTTVMKHRLQDINPELNIHTIDDFLDQENLADYIDQRYSIVIDAIDTAIVKTQLIHFCKRQKIPILTIGSAGGKKDPQKITTGDLSKTVNDPLFAKVRNNLRRLYGFSRNTKRVFSITAIYSTEQMTYPDNKGETCQSKAFLEAGSKLDCNMGFGAATMVTASFGFVAASEAIKKLIR
ncbi:tRNA threonylcarbamoyladenosine dehydratase [Candidatus Endobugula sertula]|uniref:tRNA threonylcarbamoyladenosine dehydratase n=1 Tax=Candidatus Endobugula sertula TaxID=62101 RepID=A0A1D2QMG9_9GAMM|nr:tRNA threonylcarbamoyladenosine dehydratase [Candidatus Endobugula sertula]